MSVLSGYIHFKSVRSVHRSPVGHASQPFTFVALASLATYASRGQVAVSGSNLNVINHLLAWLSKICFFNYGFDDVLGYFF